MSSLSLSSDEHLMYLCAYALLVLFSVVKDVYFHADCGRVLSSCI